MKEEDIPVFRPKPKVKEFQDPRFHQDRPDRKNGWKWYNLRRQYLMQHPWCERCGLIGEEVHHIVPRSQAPDLIYEWSNLMTLCKWCHQKEHGMGEWNPLWKYSKE